MPEISVIICFYNAFEWLKRSVGSILLQTFKDYELILVNDGSTDDSMNFALSSKAVDKRIKVVHKENGGLSSARNAGLREAHGKYIVFCDADDFFEPTALEKMHDEIIKTGADISMFGYYSDEEIGERLDMKKINPEKSSAYENKSDFFEVFRELKTKNIIDASWNKIYSADFINKSGVTFPEGENYEDTEFNLRLLMKNPKISVAKGCYYHYVQRMGSITKKHDPKKFDYLLKRVKTTEEYLDGEFIDFSSMLYIQYAYSYFADMFLTNISKDERKKEIERIITNQDFKETVKTAKASRKSDRLTLHVARSGRVQKSYSYSKKIHILKHKFHNIFVSLR